MAREQKLPPSKTLFMLVAEREQLALIESELKRIEQYVMVQRMKYSKIMEEALKRCGVDPADIGKVYEDPQINLDKGSILLKNIEKTTITKKK